MCDDDYAYQQESTIDALTEFLAPLLTDLPDVLPPLITNPIATTSQSPPLIPPVSVSYPMPDGGPTCQWVSPHNVPLICGASLSQDPKSVSEHFRQVHDVRGNEKVQVNCHWHDCDVPPMLRGSLTRHVLTVHLRLLRWRCEFCRRVFSRKGTWHACTEDGP